MANYLYRGISAPPLPEAVIKEYPYVYMLRFLDTAAFFSTSPIYYKTSVGGSSSSSGVILYYKLIDGEWQFIEEDDGFACYTSSWANHDIISDDDGTVYISASYPTDAETGEEITIYDPIPVNPAPTLDPTALLMGWQVGNRIRGGA